MLFLCFLIGSRISCVTLKTPFNFTSFHCHIAGTLTFDDGANEAALILTVVQDNLPEPIEVFIIILNPRSVTGNAVVEGLTEVRLLIEDSDNFYGIIEFGPTSSQKLITVRISFDFIYVYN